MKDGNRMLIWVAMSIFFYGMAMMVETIVMQTFLVKLGNVTAAGNVGYWIARMALGRIGCESSGNEKIARSIVVAAAIIGISLGY